MYNSRNMFSYKPNRDLYKENYKSLKIIYIENKDSPCSWTTRLIVTKMMIFPTWFVDSKTQYSQDPSKTL